MLETAIRLAAKFHCGQKDKGGKPLKGDVVDHKS